MAASAPDGSVSTGIRSEAAGISSAVTLSRTFESVGANMLQA
jgi:hypothetical protein